MSFTPRTSNSGMSSDSSVYNNDYYVGDEANYYNNNTVSTYQCTYYAIARSGEIAGEPVTTYSLHPSTPTHRIFPNRTGFNNAKAWYDDAAGSDWERSSDKYSPKVGAIIVYGASYPYSGNNGHVQVIEKIDGTTLYISQNSNCYGSSFLKAIAISDLDSSFIGYLYNPYIDEPGPGPTPGTYTVTLLASPEDAGYCTGGGTYNEGDEATFTAIPNDGYTFEKWSDGYEGNPRYWTITESFTLTAYFTGSGSKKDIAYTLEDSMVIKALEVLYGKYGSGFKRKALLGKDYKAVQERVNYILVNYSLYQRLALQVLVGLWGNGATRRKKLEACGYNYYLTQQQVALLRKKNKI